MNRRNFFKGVLASLAAMVAAPFLPRKAVSTRQSAPKIGGRHYDWLILDDLYPPHDLYPQHGALELFTEVLKNPEVIERLNREGLRVDYGKLSSLISDSLSARLAAG